MCNLKGSERMNGSFLTQLVLTPLRQGGNNKDAKTKICRRSGMQEDAGRGRI